MTRDVITVFSEQTLPLAGDIMRLKKIRHLPVVDDDGRLVGLLTHRDLLKSQVSYVSFLKEDKESRGSFDLDLPIKDIMSTEIWSIGPDAAAHEAGQLLLDHAFSCLPVVDAEHRLVGIITDRDFLKFSLEVLERFE